MKKVLFLLILCTSLLSVAQNSINYKAIIKDNLGNVVANDLIQVQFSILQGVAQTNVYQETHTPTTDANGLIIVNIGKGTTSDVFADIDWGSDDHFLNVQIDIGSGLTDMGTTQFMAVPYAIQAEKAANVTGLEAINEGSGIGWRLKGRDPARYDNIGLDAVDLSSSSSTSLVNGASGTYAIAMGRNSEASADYSTAVGLSAKALNNYSIAIGNFAESSGFYSTAIGYSVKAESYLSVALGSRNIGGGSPTSWIATDPLFEIGNGMNTSSNALTILKNGTITAPSFDLAEITDDKALITKEYADTNLNASGLEVLSEGIGTGFRIKGRDPSHYGNIGTEAIDLSYSSLSSTEYGAIGTVSTAMGIQTTAEAYGSTVIGRFNIGGGNKLGWVVTDPLFEIGNGNLSTNKNNALTILKNGKIGVDKHTGINAKLDIDHASSQTSPQINIRETSGTFARLNFSNTDSSDYWAIAGSLNGTTNTDRLNFFHSDVGDIMSIEGDGDVRVNGSVVHSSDRRLKNNIETIPYGLNEILQLQPKAYHWKAKPIKKTKSLGLIAQDVESVISEIVHSADDENKTLSVSYTELIPVLIQAIKEQQDIITSQRMSLDHEKLINKKQNSKLEALLKRVESLENSQSN